MFSFSFEAQVDPIAVAAVGLALLSLIWQIVTYVRSGARVRLTVKPDSLITGWDDASRADHVILLELVNVGEQPTTVTGYELAQWNKKWRYFCFRKPSLVLSIFRTDALKGKNSGFPYTLPPGEIWYGSFPRSEDQNRLASVGALKIRVYHSASKRPISKRIRFVRNMFQDSQTANGKQTPTENDR